MVVKDFCHLPFELILKISEYLTFSDIWYLGVCSRQTRVLSYQILKSKYGIDLIQPRIINPFGHLIHSAVAYLGRHGLLETAQGTVIEPSVLQSVANHMAIAISDRIPSKQGRAISLDFLLDKTLGILLHHCLWDPTLSLESQQVEDNYSEKVDEAMSSLQQQQAHSVYVQDIYTIQPTGTLMVDFLVTLYQTISALFDTESASEIHHRLLINHLTRQLEVIKHKYHLYHSSLSSYSQATPVIHAGNNTSNYMDEFKLFIKFLCLLTQTDLLTAKDVEEFSHHHINTFFMTRPSDVSFTSQGGFKIVMRSPNHKLAIINTNTQDKRPAFYYHWKLWLQETQFRLTVFLDLIKAIVTKHTSSPPELKQFTLLLKETVSALTLSQNMQEQVQGQVVF